MFVHKNALNNQDNNDDDNNNNNNNKNKRYNHDKFYQSFSNDLFFNELNNRRSRKPAISQAAKDELVEKLGLDYIIPNLKKDKCPFSLSWSPDATYIGLATNDSTEIFDPNSGQLLYSMKDHTQMVSIIKWFNTTQGYSELDEIPPHYELESYEREYTSNQTFENGFKSPYNSFLTCSLDNSINVYRNFKFVTKFTGHNDWLKALDLSYDDEILLSGCASSGICIWDMNVGTILHRLPTAHPKVDSNLNTINSLLFKNGDKNVFVSGSRFGTVRMWDIRTDLKQPIFHIQAHNKLNTILFTENERSMLTSGRDGAIRMWDMRTVYSEPSYKPSADYSSESKTYGVIREYKGHKCNGYNLGCTFINNDRFIVTGSEDNLVYIYETETAKIVKKILTHNHPVHLVAASKTDDFRIATASIESSNIHVYSPILKEKEDGQTLISSKFVGVTDSNRPNEEDISPKTLTGHNYLQRLTMERVMSKYGDQLFKYYHSNSIGIDNTNHSPEFLQMFQKIEEEFVNDLKEEIEKLKQKIGYIGEGINESGEIDERLLSQINLLFNDEHGEFDYDYVDEDEDEEGDDYEDENYVEDDLD